MGRRLPKRVLKRSLAMPMRGPATRVMTAPAATIPPNTDAFREDPTRANIWAGTTVRQVIKSVIQYNQYILVS